MIPELIVAALVAAIVLGLALEFRARMTAKKTGSRRRKPTGGSAVFGVMNEVFHPSASQASIIVEEQREARAPLPSPEDKQRPGQEK